MLSRTDGRKSKWKRAFHFVVLLVLTGCEDEAKHEWNVAYHSNYELAYRAAVTASTPESKENGEKEGISKAHDAARTGLAKEFYVPIVFWGVGIGVVVGMIIQYSILFTCQATKSMPGFAAFALVPAMRRSLCYSVFARRFRIIVEFNEKLQKELSDRDLKIAQVQAAHDAMTRRIIAASSIEELRDIRFVDLADEEFAKIVAQADALNQQASSADMQITRRSSILMCPHCGRRVKYPRKSSKSSINCPYQKCGREIVLPSGEST